MCAGEASDWEGGMSYLRGVLSELPGDSTVATNREGVCTLPTFDGEGVGVVYLDADGDAGDSGRRNGELRGEP